MYFEELYIRRLIFYLSSLRSRADTSALSRFCASFFVCRVNRGVLSFRRGSVVDDPGFCGFLFISIVIEVEELQALRFWVLRSDRSEFFKSPPRRKSMYENRQENYKSNSRPQFLRIPEISIFQRKADIK